MIEPAFKLAVVFLRDPGEAEDAVQEACFKAWKSLYQLRPEASTRPYQRDKTIPWALVVAQPGPGGSNASDITVKFRGGLARYYVYDSTSRLSQRWLTWTGPGTMANPQLKGRGVPYFLSADGLTDQEFWQLANSLK